MKYFTITLDFDQTQIIWELKPDSRLVFAALPSRFPLILTLVIVAVLILIIVIVVSVRVYQRKRREDMEKIEKLYLESVKPSLKLVTKTGLINGS